MSKINYIIPAQGFELVRERIAAILIDEISNQVVLSYDTSIDAEVLIESINPQDKEFLPAINVSLATGTWLNQNQGSKDGTYIYNIDCYTNAPSTEDSAGDYLANAQLQKILGICRAILENPIYKTLGFTPPFIHRVFCSDINFANAGKNDALNSVMGRITFTVTVTENTLNPTPSLIEGYDTTVKIDTTDKGYYYSG